MEEVTRRVGEAKPQGWTKPILIGGAGVVLIQIVYFALVVFGFGKPENSGIFGDMFGALNTMFTGLGFMGAVYVIHRQVTDSHAARVEQEESFRLLQSQVVATQKGVESAQKGVELQAVRDRVEAGPFFQLTSNSRTGTELHLDLTNVGAPIICLDFESVTKGCSIAVPWYPNTLPQGEVFKARCQVAPEAKVFEFRMKLRDRWGTNREFGIKLDQTSGVGRLDFWDVEQLGSLIAIPQPSARA